MSLLYPQLHGYLQIGPIIAFYGNWISFRRNTGKTNTISYKIAILMAELTIEAAYAAFALSCLSSLRNSALFDLRRLSPSPFSPSQQLTGAVLAAFSALTALNHYSPCTSGVQDQCYPFFLHSQVAICLLVQHCGQLNTALQL